MQRTHWKERIWTYSEVSYTQVIHICSICDNNDFACYGLFITVRDALKSFVVVFFIRYTVFFLFWYGSNVTLSWKFIIQKDFKNGRDTQTEPILWIHIMTEQYERFRSKHHRSPCRIVEPRPDLDNQTRQYFLLCFTRFLT